MISGRQQQPRDRWQRHGTHGGDEAILIAIPFSRVSRQSHQGDFIEELQQKNVCGSNPWEEPLS